MREALLVIAEGHEVLLKYVPDDPSSCYIPDSRTVWDMIWENRDKVIGIAHSHPGSGTPSPSMEDLTTFHAVEAGLGKKLCWWISSRDQMRVFITTDAKLVVIALPSQLPGMEEMPWLTELRSLSQYDR